MMTIQTINDKVNEIRETLQIKVPANAKNIAITIGGRIDYSDELDKDINAIIKKEGRLFRITINKKQIDPTRENMQIAHALGHLFLHMGYLLDNPSYGQSDEYIDSANHRYGYSLEEKEANEFAACLVMPENTFKTIAYAHMINQQFTIAPIAEHFRVSVNDVIDRGKAIGLFQ